MSHVIQLADGPPHYLLGDFIHKITSTGVRKMKFPCVHRLARIVVRGRNRVSTATCHEATGFDMPPDALPTRPNWSVKLRPT